MSVNNFFYKPPKFLREHRIWLVDFLKLYDRPQKVIDVYLWAYDYCVQNPDSYDGATMTEDLGKDGLDVEAMLHDVLYVALNTAGSFKYQYVADKIIKREMEAHEKSSIETGKRFYLLLLKMVLGFPLYARFIKKRKMTKGDRERMRELEKIFLRGYRINWRRELKWVFIVVAVILIVLFRIDITNLLKLLF